MKTLLLCFLSFAFQSGFSQDAAQADKTAVVEKVQQFFLALEKKDTALYQSLAFTHGQIWTVRRQQDSLKHTMRSFSDDIKRLPAIKEVLSERALDYEIHLHNDIAVVWAPYTFSRGGKFSHCGVDVFTLVKTMYGWKMVSLVYSVEPEGCASLTDDNSGKKGN
jgi:hypothetical protein